MELKTYSRASLLAMCGERGPKGVLPWHVLRDDGLWLAAREPLTSSGDREVMQWHPRQDLDMPALPVPFTAYDLAAFFLAGGGLFLREVFDNGDSLDEAALAEMGSSAGNAREALLEAHRLCVLADAKFGRDDQGVLKSACWLLNEAHCETPADAKLAVGVVIAASEVGTLGQPAVVRHTIKTKGRDILDPAIERAQAKCDDPKDTAQVWARMQVLAQDEHPPLLAATPQGLKYTKNGRDAYFTRDALDKRLHPEKRRPRR